METDKTSNNKTRALHALAFPALWVLYGVFVIATNPASRSLAAVLGLFVGAVFLYGTGLLLLRLVGKKRLSARFAALLFLLLAAADQLVKLAVLRFIPAGESLPIAGEWFAIRQIPNYSNSVAFSLAGVVISPVWMAAGKCVVLVLFALFLYRYAKSQHYDMGDGRFRLAVCLIGAAAVCSIAETIYRGYILDFISFGFLVGFDCKDLYLMYGIGLLFPVLFLWEKRAAKQNKNPEG